MSQSASAPVLSDDPGTHRLRLRQPIVCCLPVDHQGELGGLEGNDLDEIEGAVAEFGHAQMGVAAEHEAGSDEQTVDLDAGRAWKFKRNLHIARI